jgi:hypothetical protein
MESALPGESAAMSEYQYYEFQATDRPLTKADREMLRSLSTRARITATSFTNHYEWGDFKGDPRRLHAMLRRQLGQPPLAADRVQGNLRLELGRISRSLAHIGIAPSSSRSTLSNGPNSGDHLSRGVSPDAHETGRMGSDQCASG